MDSEQSTLSERASSKAIGAAGSEPAMCPFMVDMRVNPESYQKIAVQEPDHPSRLVGLNPVHVFGGDQPFPGRHREIGWAALSQGGL